MTPKFRICSFYLHITEKTTRRSNEARASSVIGSIADVCLICINI